ncbi:hypothetical protein P4126_31165 [Pseudomonas aeruginosa]|nr:hypothetical protein [Pseudomonas aeruginosa]
MPKLPMLALAAVAAAVISVPASAGDRITIQTEVTKGGVVLSSGTQEISKGATAHFNDGRFKEIDTNVTVTCREGISRWLNPFKPACDKPTREKEKGARWVHGRYYGSRSVRRQICRLCRR